MNAAVEGFLHDLGKLRRDQKTLVKKNGALTPSEFTVIKQHPLIGATALGSLFRHRNGEFFPTNADHFNGMWKTAIMHHVRPDGHKTRSYPEHIKPVNLTPEVQLTTLTDAFDAMTSDRAYRRHSDVKEKKVSDGFAEIERYKGKQFNPDRVELLLKLRPTPKID